MVMRIAHVITKGDVGGAQTHVVDLATAQHGTGHVVKVVAGTGGPAVERLRESGVEVVVAEALGRADWSRWPRTAVSSLREALVGFDPDVIHGHSSIGGLLARWVARRMGVTSVYTAHGWPFQPGAAPFQRGVSLVGEFAGGRLGDGVICLTSNEAELARRFRIGRGRPIWVIPNGIVDVPERMRLHNGGGGPVRIVMVARFAPPKLQEELLTAMSRCRSSDWELVFVGDGPDRHRSEALASRLLPGKCTFLGSRNDVAEILATCDLMVLWSRYEGQPISLLEGMRSGVCCIGSDLPGVRSLFGNPAVGVVAGTVDGLASSIDRLLEDHATRRALAEAGRRRYEEEFTIDRQLARTLAVYTTMLLRQSNGHRRDLPAVPDRQP